MPRKYKIKKRFGYKKKRFNKKKSKKSKPVVIRTGSYITPDKVQTICTWTQSLNSTTLSPLRRKYSLNGIWDPDLNFATGVSALGLYQWSQLYNKYRVYGSKISVQARSLNTGQDICMVLVPSLTDPDLNYEDAIARPYSAHTMLPTFAAGYFKMLKTYMSMKKVMGLSSASQQDEDYASNCNSNPEKEAVWQLYFADITTPLSGIQVVYTVKIQYYVEFYNRKDIVHFQQDDIPGPDEHINFGPTGISSDFISGTTGLPIV